MKTAEWMAVVLFMAVNPAALAQPYSLNIVGYVNAPVAAGENLVGNPLNHSDNVISAIFQQPPEGSTFTKWDAVDGRFLPVSIYTTHSGWSFDYQFPLGEGALFYSPEAFTQTYVGEVLLAPGSTGDPVVFPSPPERPAGTHLVASLTPANSRNFEDLVGRAPLEGESFTKLTAWSQTYHTTTFRNGGWDNGQPSLDIAQAAFVTLFAPSTYVVPEPRLLMLLNVAAVLTFGCRRRGRRV